MGNQGKTFWDEVQIHWKWNMQLMWVVIQYVYVYGYSVIGIPIPSADINCYNESYMDYKPNNSYKLVTCSEMVRLLLKYVVKL